MTLEVVMDGRPLQAGFKAHRRRGIGRYARNLLAAMSASPQPPSISLLTQAGLADGDLPQGLPRLTAEPAPAWLPWGKRVLTYHCLARRPLAAAWQQGRVVHFLSHLDAPARLGPGTVLTVHDLIAQKLEDLYRGSRSRIGFRLARWLETRCLYQAERLIAVSEHTKNDLVQIYGLDPGRITVIQEAADPGLAPVGEPEQRAAVLARLGLAAGPGFFLYVGAIDQRKGINVLLEALSILRQKGEPHDLALAGEIKNDRQYPGLVREIKRLGLTDRVHLLGFVSEADLAALFSACLAFVFPSLYEGFGLPPLEAMVCGAPVVAARAAALPEVVDQAGLLVEPGDAADLARAMSAVAGDRELADRLREKGYKRADRFSWSQTAAQTLALYREVAHGR